MAYWTSWFAVANVYSILVALSTWAAGSAFGFGFFTETPFYVSVFLLLYPFCLAMQMLAFCVSALSPSLKASNTASYAIMLFAIVVEAFVSDNMLLTFLFTEDSGAILTFLKYFFCFYPPFSYTKVLPMACRSSPTSPSILAATSASWRGGGCLRQIPMTGASTLKI